MARVNIEDSLFKDNRYTDLIIKTGCQYKAIGLVTSAWILAQEHWIKHRCVPAKAWRKDLNILIEVELAELLENGDVYVKGSKTAFLWLEQKVEAGRKGGLVKKTEAGAKHTLPPAKRDQAAPKPLTLTPSLSPTLSLTQVPTQTLVLPLSQEGDTTAKAAPSPKLIEIWNDNCGPLAKVKSANSKRLRLIATRWRELDELQWVEVVQRLSRSNFCTGQNDRGWRADFDFLLKADTATKTLEGRYDNREGLKNGMTEDGRYLTPAMKRSHNNLTMFKKLNEGDKNDEPTERDVKASLPNG